MSSLSKMLSVLDLFTFDKPVWSAESISSAIGCSAPTGYRYVRELVSTGLLLRLGTGSYSLGPRIISLDYQLRTGDPYYCAGRSLMADLAHQTGCDCVMSRLFDDQVIDTHRESGPDGLQLAYGRGRPRPLFRGSAPKVILATLPRAKLKRIYRDHADEIIASGLVADWDDFWRILEQTKKAGHYLSRGELESDVGSIAVPFFGDTNQAIGALALVIPVRRLDFMNHEKLLQLLLKVAETLRTAARAGSMATP